MIYLQAGAIFESFNNTQTHRSITINYLQTEYAFKENITCIYVYFDFMEQRKHDLISLLSSLLAQLIQARDFISEEVKEIHRVLKVTGGYPSSDDLLSMLRYQMKLFSRVFIVVDALDECPNDTTSIETNTMDKFLKVLHQLPSNAHILYTSRHDIRIGQGVEADCELEIVAHDTDLRNYFENQIKGLEHLKRLVDKGMQRDKCFLDNVLGTVVKKSQGMQVLGGKISDEELLMYRQVSTRATPH